MANQQIKLQTLKGFRDFLPLEKRNRDYVIGRIKQVFERFGFDPIETPTLEYAAVLQGKYGEEADKLMYTFEDKGGRMVGLRYDQTVPTARFLSQYSGTLPKYFRRYQIQNVFRAENTQAGRFREFTQCDCDIFGSTSSVADAEILAVFYQVYKELGFDSFIIRVNDRQTLFETIKPFESSELSTLSIIQTIDKLDKIQEEGVVEELMKKGLPKENAQLLLKKLNETKVPINLQVILDQAEKLGVPKAVFEFQPYLARGLDYYTGLIFEGIIPEYGSGSVGGGGRYDNLISDLGGPQVPAVGFAVGFDRTVEVLEKLQLIPDMENGTQVLVTVFDEKLAPVALEIAKKFREQNINTEIIPTTADKIGKQLKYADLKKIPFVIIVGPDEAKENKLTVKNMKSGEEKRTDIQEAIEICK
ncbi:histidine--tRNA ligase [Candidatus Roizmanbacteria bacterium]|nr:MAG: histidine--tRNA ligase [Candidatus Roizmanbacteria bacterium]